MEVFENKRITLFNYRGKKYTVVTRHTGAEQERKRRLPGPGGSGPVGSAQRQGALEEPRRASGGVGGVPRCTVFLFLSFPGSFGVPCLASSNPSFGVRTRP